ncbi:MAG: acyl-CoA dehydrogenase family protein [Candidatus Lambdaproteobacteria bacterium]|nr:acyl-CoA dehydrogenase family protein [Candidatus Lambdaproteobacteria bacterium]
MVDFSVPDDLKEICDGLLQFVDREVLTLEEANRDLLEHERNTFDETGRFVPEVQALRKQVRMKSAAAGFYTMFGAEELGGAGLGPLSAVYIHDRLNARYGPGHYLIQEVVIPSPFTNGLSPVLRHLRPELRDKLLPGIASGERTLCFGLSEPDAGSDVFAMRTRAVRDGDHWVLNGVKQWITNGPYADYAMVFAVTDPEQFAQRQGGVTGFLVDTASPGFDNSTVIRYMGHQGSEIGFLNLENVRVHESRVLGEVNGGFKIAIGGVNVGRLGLAAKCIGMSRWALEQAVEYAKIRKTFGKAIAEHQAIQFMLAECAMDIYAGKNMALNCAWKLEQGLPALKEISMVKAFCTEMGNRVMDRVIQVHGGMGLTNEMRFEEGYRFIRTLRIPDGTAEIQRRTIARQLLAGDIQL